LPESDDDELGLLSDELGLLSDELGLLSVEEDVELVSLLAAAAGRLSVL
jgi:hypothetical protein